jgi:signal transduction histidine kinase
MLFSIFIFVLLWVLQVIFLETYYTSMKKDQIEKIGKEIAKWYGYEGMEEQLRAYAMKYNMSINIYNAHGNVRLSIDAFNAYRESWPLTPSDGNLNLEAQFIELKDQLTAQNSSQIHYTKGDGDGLVFFYGEALEVSEGVAGLQEYLLVASPLPQTDTTTLALKNLLFIITAILFLISLLMAQLISRKLSIPIINLTRSAQKLAAGKMHVRFNEDEGYTEIHHLASALNYATRELSKLDEYRKDLIANVSHDLKTPLTIIKFYGEMIRDVSGTNPVKREEHCELIIKETDRLASLVTEILELSKIQSNNAVFSPAVMNLSGCLKETLAGFEALGEQEGFIFHVEIDNDLRIRADEAMIQRVFYNLISNALHYTGDDKSVIVTLRKTRRSRARFEVRDTGKGIQPDKLRGIWERYYKEGTPSHQRSVVGTGLGLAIVKNILVTHHAAFGVKSKVNRGSTFWFEMPITEKIS